MICNVALTIPARIVIGSLVDRSGPKRVFTGLLIFTGAVSIYFSLATSFGEFLVSRLLMGCAGAGFVVGIKMIAEWFPPDRMGTAQGLYAGWGNFGAAAALFALPPIAALFSQELGWRVATAFSGLLCLVWAGVYHRWASEVPGRAKQFPRQPGKHHRSHFKKRSGSANPFNDSSLYGYRFTGLEAGVFSRFSGRIPGGNLSVGRDHRVFYPQCYALCEGQYGPASPTTFLEEKKYAFSQIAILSLVYALTFGSELAIVSMFPQFLESTFHLTGDHGRHSRIMCGFFQSDHASQRRMAIRQVGKGAGFCSFWCWGRLSDMDSWEKSTRNGH